MNLPKSLDYRRATRLREIRRMRAALFRELTRYSLARVPIPAAGRSAATTVPYAYAVLYCGVPYKYYDFATTAVNSLFRLRALSYRLGLIRIQMAVKNL